METDRRVKRVVVVGGGVAGLEIATMLGRRWRDKQGMLGVVLIDSDSSHVWKPMLHTIAAGTRDLSLQQTPFLAQARDAGFEYRPGEMCGLDRAAREVLIAPVLGVDGRMVVPARRVPYDALVVAVGSEANDFGIPGVKERCFRIDSRLLADAFNREVRERMIQAFALQQSLSIAIVGGGATGVELAAELIQLTHAAVAYGAKDLASRIHVTLIESGERLLAGFPEDISAATKARLESIGIVVMLKTQVSAATDDGFTLNDGGHVHASLRVWAAGVKAPTFLANLDGLETARGNQLIVGPTLQTTQDPNIFAVGDCASFKMPRAERPLPPTAQVAHQQAQHLIRHLPGYILNDRPMPSFKYHDLGALVSLADYDAYGSLGKFGFFKGVTIRGTLAQFSHAMLYRSHQARLYGFWRGGLLWLVDRLNARLRSSIRLD